MRSVSTVRPRPRASRSRRCSISAFPFVDRHIAEGRSDKVVTRGRTWQMTFGELHDAVLRMGNVYRSLGVRPGDRVLLLSRDTRRSSSHFLARRGSAQLSSRATHSCGPPTTPTCSRDSAAKVVLVTDPAGDRRGPEGKGVAVEHRIAIETPREGWLRLEECLRLQSRIVRSSLRLRIRHASGSIRRDRPARRKLRSTSTRRSCLHVRVLCSAHARHHRRTTSSFRRPKLFFAYGIGNSFSFPLWMAASDPAGRPPDRREYPRHDRALPAAPSISVCRRFMRLRSRDRKWPRDRDEANRACACRVASRCHRR